MIYVWGNARETCNFVNSPGLRENVPIKRGIIIDRNFKIRLETL